MIVSCSCLIWLGFVRMQKVKRQHRQTTKNEEDENDVEVKEEDKDEDEDEEVGEADNNGDDVSGKVGDLEKSDPEEENKEPEPRALQKSSDQKQRKKVKSIASGEKKTQEKEIPSKILSMTKDLFTTVEHDYLFTCLQKTMKLPRERGSAQTQQFWKNPHLLKELPQRKNQQTKIKAKKTRIHQPRRRIIIKNKVQKPSLVQILLA